MRKDDLMFLIRRANKEGARGNRVLDIQLPTDATQNITNTIFIVDRPQNESVTQKLWYE